MIYLDNAATTMRKPEVVVQAVTEAMCTMGNAGRGVHDAALDASRIIFDTRMRLAEFFHAESPTQIVFTMNSTESLNIAIKGILEAGDHVITTALEHNSVLRPLYEMEEKGVELTIFPSDKQGRICYEDFEKHIKANTRAIICTHGSNLTGNLVDIDRVGAIAKAHGILFVVDASQTAGVFPIDVQEMNIDILCFTGHKGLLGPQGTGGMYVREGLKVKPLLSGGSGVQTYSKNHPAQMPTALEAGTLNAHGLAGLRAAIGYLQSIGIDTIRKKEQELMWYFYGQVKEIPGVKIYGDFSQQERCAIVTLNLWEYDSSEVSDALFMNYGISTRPGAHCAPLMHQALGTVEQGAVRFSFSHYNTKEEVDQVVEALRELASED
ncbi:MAG: aminotransferase class V-fold PLP-dependent enzyme [Ruminococcus sp.]|nr:aminotransferase class V-fold PLP-dependent enzyme [Ruminococcus sp.]